MIYGYCRISTRKQKLSRQEENIKKNYPDAVIYKEAYTGTTLERPVFSRLLGRIKSGDTIVFDEVSRMSRDAIDGYSLYEQLYEKNIELVFLKQPHINTSVFREAAARTIPKTGTAVDGILSAVETYMRELAKQQIELAFQAAQAEVDLLHKRTSDGVRRAQASGKKIGIEKGRKLVTKKSIKAKETIKRWSKDFGGTMTDAECRRQCGISRNSYFKYKKELLEEQ